MNQKLTQHVTDISAIPNYENIIPCENLVPDNLAKYFLLLRSENDQVILLFADKKVAFHDLSRARFRIAKEHHDQRVIVMRTTETIISDVRLHNEAKQLARAEREALMDESHFRDTFRAIIREAVDEGVSDIHFERLESMARVRFHRPGGLQTVRTTSEPFMLRMCSVVYDTIADPDTKETKYIDAQPQRARASVAFDDLSAELRIQTVPAFPMGSDMIIRILAIIRRNTSGHEKETPTLEESGYLPDAAKMIREATSMPNGLLVFCGTVNSGKSTTIANLFRRLIKDNQGHLKVMTLEDPPESTIDGATQVPIEQIRASLKSKNDADPEANAYAEGIKIALRSDIHKLIVGEIRGAELARPLTNAVRSGHFTATTIHAGSSVEAISRMIDLGMLPEDLSSPGFLNAVIYQRLMPGLCTHCRRGQGDFPEVLKPIMDDINRFSVFVSMKTPNYHWRNPEGCEHCQGGVNRRLLIAEALFPDDQMRRHIRKKDMIELRDAWIASGAHPVAHHALLRCFAGDIDPNDMVLEGVRWTDIRDWIHYAMQKNKLSVLQSAANHLRSTTVARPVSSNPA